ncbi:MAG: hypothetical protein BWY06_02773 [Candidatus Latescibacteria bacterium ADurb.Bin168]|nr:MAG: hypothetical protein BWY06_02773 [Candidatus Latescibacteria bacterium ADurb.Bin168]
MPIRERRRLVDRLCTAHHREERILALIHDRVFLRIGEPTGSPFAANPRRIRQAVTGNRFHVQRVQRVVRRNVGRAHAKLLLNLRHFVGNAHDGTRPPHFTIRQIVAGLDPRTTERMGATRRSVGDVAFVIDVTVLIAIAHLAILHFMAVARGAPVLVQASAAFAPAAGHRLRDVVTAVVDGLIPVENHETHVPGGEELARDRTRVAIVILAGKTGCDGIVLGRILIAVTHPHKAHVLGPGTVVILAIVVPETVVVILAAAGRKVGAAAAIIPLIAKAHHHRADRIVHATVLLNGARARVAPQSVVDDPPVHEHEIVILPVNPRIDRAVRADAHTRP